MLEILGGIDIDFEGKIQQVSKTKYIQSTKL